ncbi:hypothetical protein LTR62_003856 [Meristemomyces frigidus]|uniref:Dolichyl-diphosphooligosaccharide--protein glycosyltransferase subunit WBP1 n=1 Tax=Meristemomyces frigidus TaxID=1508187 RepID=A0AAN7TI96_9PEZI|nr:hypothetical protein LTR62_003856 [Meristemomyces frigidus]
MRLRILGLIAGFLGLVSALSAQGNKVLVVLEDEADKSKYSQLWAGLSDRGFQLSYQTPKATGLSLFQHGVPAYTHLLLLPTKSKGLGPNLTPNLIVEFVNAGSNVLLTLSSETGVPSAIASLLLELDIALPPDRNSVVVDHFNYDAKSAGEGHDTLLLSSTKAKAGLKDYFSFPSGLLALPHPVGQVLGPASPLLSSIVKAPSTAYTHDSKSDSTTESIDDVFATGNQITLVSAFQARNSARFTVLGSAEALEDKWFDASVQLPSSSSNAKATAEKTSNKAFAAALTAWTFKETGVLKVESVNHRLAADTPKDSTSKAVTGHSFLNLEENPSIYRIKNNVHYTIALSEWSHNSWQPFQPATSDAVQLEFSMLSPFHRLNLSPSTTQSTANSTLLEADFTLPDQHGIFNFLVEYRRPFLTNIEEKRSVTVRHFAHDEWPRSFAISGAYPWIGGVWITIGAWVVFVALWLYSAPAKPRGELKVQGGKGGGR